MFGALNPWLILAAFAGITAAFFGGAITGKKYAEGQQAAQEVLILQTAQATQEAVAQQIAQIKIKNTVIKRSVEREVLEKPVYRDCGHDADSLRLINSALAGANSEPDHRLPSKPGNTE